jgi:hypothetical protein
MCEPVSIGLGVASLAVGTAGTIQANNAQRQASREQRRANAQLQADTAQAADMEFALTTQQLRERRDQEELQAAEVMQQNTTTARRSALASTRAAAMADAQARVAAGAGGVRGASVTALLSDIERTDATNQLVISEDYQRAQSNIQTNLRFANQQREMEGQQAALVRQNRLNGVANLPAAPMPSPWIPAIQIATQVVGFADQLTNRTPNSPRGQIPNG